MTGPEPVVLPITPPPKVRSGYPATHGGHPRRCAHFRAQLSIRTRRAGRREAERLEREPTPEPGSGRVVDVTVLESGLVRDQPPRRAYGGPSTRTPAGPPNGGPARHQRPGASRALHATHGPQRRPTRRAVRRSRLATAPPRGCLDATDATLGARAARAQASGPRCRPWMPETWRKSTTFEAESITVNVRVESGHVSRGALHANRWRDDHHNERRRAWQGARPTVTSRPEMLDTAGAMRSTFLKHAGLLEEA